MNVGDPITVKGQPRSCSTGRISRIVTTAKRPYVNYRCDGPHKAEHAAPLEAVTIVTKSA